MRSESQISWKDHSHAAILDRWNRQFKLFLVVYNHDNVLTPDYSVAQIISFLIRKAGMTRMQKIFQSLESDYEDVSFEELVRTINVYSMNSADIVMLDRRATAFLEFFFHYHQDKSGKNMTAENTHSMFSYGDLKSTMVVILLVCLRSSNLYFRPRFFNDFDFSFCVTMILLNMSGEQPTPVSNAYVPTDESKNIRLVTTDTLFAERTTNVRTKNAKRDCKRFFQESVSHRAVESEQMQAMDREERSDRNEYIRVTDYFFNYALSIDWEARFAIPHMWNRTFIREFRRFNTMDLFLDTLVNHSLDSITLSPIALKILQMRRSHHVWTSTPMSELSNIGMSPHAEYIHYEDSSATKELFIQGTPDAFYFTSLYAMMSNTSDPPPHTMNQTCTPLPNSVKYNDKYRLFDGSIGYTPSTDTVWDRLTPSQWNRFCLDLEKIKLISHFASTEHFAKSQSRFPPHTQKSYGTYGRTFSFHRKVGRNIYGRAHTTFFLSFLNVFLTDDLEDVGIRYMVQQLIKKYPVISSPVIGSASLNDDRFNVIFSNVIQYVNGEFEDSVVNMIPLSREDKTYRVIRIDMRPFRQSNFSIESTMHSEYELAENMKDMKLIVGNRQRVEQRLQFIGTELWRKYSEGKTDHVGNNTMDLWMTEAHSLQYASLMAPWCILLHCLESSEYLCYRFEQYVVCVTAIECNVTEKETEQLNEARRSFEIDYEDIKGFLEKEYGDVPFIEDMLKRTERKAQSLHIVVYEKNAIEQFIHGKTPGVNYAGGADTQLRENIGTIFYSKLYPRFSICDQESKFAVFKRRENIKKLLEGIPSIKHIREMSQVDGPKFCIEGKLYDSIQINAKKLIGMVRQGLESMFNYNLFHGFLSYVTTTNVALSKELFASSCGSVTVATFNALVRALNKLKTMREYLRITENNEKGSISLDNSTPLCRRDTFKMASDNVVPIQESKYLKVLSSDTDTEVISRFIPSNTRPMRLTRRNFSGAYHLAHMADEIRPLENDDDATYAYHSMTPAGIVEHNVTLGDMNIKLRPSLRYTSTVTNIMSFTPIVKDGITVGVEISIDKRYASTDMLFFLCRRRIYTSDTTDAYSSALMGFERDLEVVIGPDSDQYQYIPTQKDPMSDLSDYTIMKSMIYEGTSVRCMFPKHQDGESQALGNTDCGTYYIYGIDISLCRSHNIREKLRNRVIGNSLTSEDRNSNLSEEEYAKNLTGEGDTVAPPGISLFALLHESNESVPYKGILASPDDEYMFDFLWNEAWKVKYYTIRKWVETGYQDNQNLRSHLVWNLQFQWQPQSLDLFSNNFSGNSMPLALPYSPLYLKRDKFDHLFIDQLYNRWRLTSLISTMKDYEPNYWELQQFEMGANGTAVYMFNTHTMENEPLSRFFVTPKPRIIQGTGDGIFRHTNRSFVVDNIQENTVRTPLSYERWDHSPVYENLWTRATVVRSFIEKMKSMQSLKKTYSGRSMDGEDMANHIDFIEAERSPSNQQWERLTGFTWPPPNFAEELFQQKHLRLPYDINAEIDIDKLRLLLKSYDVTTEQILKNPEEGNLTDADRKRVMQEDMDNGDGMFFLPPDRHASDDDVLVSRLNYEGVHHRKTNKEKESKRMFAQTAAQQLREVKCVGRIDVSASYTPEVSILKSKNDSGNVYETSVINTSDTVPWRARDLLYYARGHISGSVAADANSRPSLDTSSPHRVFEFDMQQINSVQYNEIVNINLNLNDARKRLRKIHVEFNSISNEIRHIEEDDKQAYDRAKKRVDEAMSKFFAVKEYIQVHKEKLDQRNIDLINEVEQRLYSGNAPTYGHSPILFRVRYCSESELYHPSNRGSDVVDGNSSFFRTFINSGSSTMTWNANRSFFFPKHATDKEAHTWIRNYGRRSINSQESIVLYTYPLVSIDIPDTPGVPFMNFSKNKRIRTPYPERSEEYMDTT